MNETLKKIINIGLMIILIVVAILSINNVKKNCEKRINDIESKESKCYADLGMYKIDLDQCRDYLTISSESLWDCQEKWDLCLDKC